MGDELLVAPQRRGWAYFRELDIPFDGGMGLNLAVWPQTDRKKILAEFKFGGGVSGPFIN